LRYMVSSSSKRLLSSLVKSRKMAVVDNDRRVPVLKNLKIGVQLHICLLSTAACYCSYLAAGDSC
jgi:hypothetical protein